MKHKNIKFAIALAFMLLFSTSVFAQEWEYSIPYLLDTVFCQFQDAYELGNGNIVVKEIVVPGGTRSTRTKLTLLSPEGNVLARTEQYKPSFWNYNMHFLTNDEDELFALTSYTPDHDYNSPNYFMNFDTVPDYAILGLYKFDDSLHIVQSMEHMFPVDTFEMRGNEWWESSKNMCSGYIWPISAFVDDDGYIVGNYVKAISFGHEDIAKDTMVVFRMDFNGNFVTKVDIACVKTSGDLHPVNWTARSGDMVKTNDSTYVMYDLDMGMFGTHTNVVYFDYDFNVTLKRLISNPNASDPYHKQWPTIVRSSHNTTYITASVSEETKNTYVIRLYEYDESDGQGGYMPPVRYVKRSYDWDHSAIHRGLDKAKDGTMYFAYSLNIGFCNCHDSWMVIERLDENMDTISTLYYDINGGTDIFSEAYSIRELSDGGVLLVSNSKDLNNTNQRWMTATKFPAKTFWDIEEAHENNLKLAIAYPNPGGNVLNIRTGLRNARVEVYGMNGRLVHSQALTESITPINAEAWPAGIYVWKVLDNGKETETGKWIKE